MKGLIVGASQPSFWLPEQASTLAAEVDSAWALVFWLSVFFFALVSGLTVFFAIRFRHRKGRAHVPGPENSTSLELFWSVIPTILVVILCWRGYRTYLNMVTPPLGTYEVQVIGQKWNWLFSYPDGYIDADLHVPVGRPVRLVMTSEDVIHSLLVPQFRIKRDVMPGRESEVWFEAIATGEYDVFCAEYCGTSHARMISKVVVHERDEFDVWLEEASDFLSRMPPAEAGARLYDMLGCKQCHSLDGTDGIGPTFRGLYGTNAALRAGGAVVVDESYVRESILEPQARQTAGYDPVMPTYQGLVKDEEISAIIEYLKSLAPGSQP